jgi:hypothetical protein
MDPANSNLNHVVFTVNSNNTSSQGIGYVEPEQSKSMLAGLTIGQVCAAWHGSSTK